RCRLPDEVEVGEHEHLSVFLVRAAHGETDDLARLVNGDVGPGPLDDDDVGVDVAQHAHADGARAVAPVGAEQSGGEGARRLALARARRADEEVGVHGRAGRRLQPAGGLVLTDEGTQNAHRDTAAHSSRAARTRAATSSTEPTPSTTTQRSGSAAASSRYPAATRSWNPAPSDSMRS